VSGGRLAIVLHTHMVQAPVASALLSSGPRPLVDIDRKAASRLTFDLNERCGK
jgi:hypothetical protein